jgi:hypothetical protein
MTQIKKDDRVFRKLADVQAEQKAAPAPKETKPKKAAPSGKKGSSKS